MERDQNALSWAPWSGEGHQAVGRWHAQTQCPEDTLSSPLPRALGSASLSGLTTHQLAEQPHEPGV